jgi:hypothetical protein
MNITDSSSIWMSWDDAPDSYTSASDLSTSWGDY